MATRGLLLGTVFDPEVDLTTYVMGGSDYLQSSQGFIGIGGAWSIAFWVRRSVALNTDTIWEIAGDTPADGNLISLFDLDNTYLSLVVADPTGALTAGLTKTYYIKDLAVDGPAAAWEHFVFVYSILADTLLVYYNGAVLPTSVQSGVGDPWVDQFQDGTPSQTDTSRNITLGSDHDGAGGQWEGRIYNWACWSSVLTPAAIAQIYNAGNGTHIDLEVNAADYISSANLQHLYRFDDTSDRGRDRGNAIVSLNVGDESSGTNTFVINDFPGTAP